MKFSREFPEVLKVASKYYNASKNKVDENDGFLESHLLSLLMKILNFKVEFVDPVDKEMGRLTENGNWTGLVGLIQREVADIGLNTGVTDQRRLAVDYSYPYEHCPVTFITDQLSYSSSIYAILYPFSSYVWYATLISLTIVALISYCFNRRMHNSENLVLITFGILFEQSMNLKFLKLSTKLLITFWIVGVMFITFSYKAVLLSFLTFPTLTGVKDITQLSKASQSSSFKCATYAGSIFYETLKTSTYESWNNVADCMDRSNMFTQNIEDFIRSTNYKKAFIATRYRLEPMSANYFIPEENFFTLMIAIAVRKTFCCKDVLDEVIHKITAAGMFDKIRRDTVFINILKDNTSKTKERGLNRRLSLHDVSGAFLILIFGYISACVVYLMEVSFRY